LRGGCRQPVGCRRPGRRAAPAHHGPHNVAETLTAEAGGRGRSRNEHGRFKSEGDRATGVEVVGERGSEVIEVAAGGCPRAADAPPATRLPGRMESWSIPCPSGASLPFTPATRGRRSHRDLHPSRPPSTRHAHQVLIQASSWETGLCRDRAPGCDQQRGPLLESMKERGSWPRKRMLMDQSTILTFSACGPF